MGLWVIPAAAQNPAAAEALFDQARAAMAAGELDLACARFRDSDKLDPAVGTRFNLADCEERRGRLATAWSLFRGVLSELRFGDDRRPIAEERIKALEPRLPRLTLVRARQTPPGLTVRVDGAELGEASFGVALPMDPGQHELVLQVSGGSAERTTFSMEEGQLRELPLRLRAGSPTAAAPGPAEPTQVADDGGSRRRWAFVAGGIGLGGIAFGAVTGVVTLNKKSTADEYCSDLNMTCEPEGVAANDSGRTYAALSVAGFGLGAAGLALGAYLLFTEKPARHSAPGVAVVPELRLQKDRGLFGVAGRF